MKEYTKEFHKIIIKMIKWRKQGESGYIYQWTEDEHSRRVDFGEDEFSRWSILVCIKGGGKAKQKTWVEVERKRR